MSDHDELFELDTDMRLREHIAKSDHNFHNAAVSLQAIIMAAEVMLDRIEALERKVKELTNG